MRLVPVLLLVVFPAVICAQNVVSARAGLVHHADGRVLLDEKPIVHKITQFSEVKENSELRTEQGRAEILLTPGVFLRLGEDSRLTMLSSKLTDVRVRLDAGSSVIEVDELDKAGSITIVAGDQDVRLERTGLYHFDLFADEAPRLRVFAGEALVGKLKVGAKKEVRLDGDLTVSKFNPEDTDPLDRWSRRRANYVSMASVSASRLAYDRDMRFSRSSWFFNPLYGMYAFIPYRGIAYSPYGFGFYSPRVGYALYHRPVYSPAPMASGGGPSFNSGYGYSTVPHTSSGTSGVVASSPSSSVSQGGNATVSRGGGTSGGGSRR